jgi:hypothetical protein
MNHMFVGYDDRESEAAQVLKFSIERQARSPIDVQFLKHKPLRESALFSRPWRVGETGQMVDERDGRPFSTQFAHSRFLVPELARRQGLTGWVGFMDCDMLPMVDLNEVFDLLDDNKALACVKHRAEHLPDGTKMDNVAQRSYRRKLWSSFMFFNMNHPVNQNLTINAVNNMTGTWLHGLGWCPDDNLIQGLPEGWNWCIGMSPTLDPEPDPRLYNLHWTVGGPWMEGYENVMYADAWKKEHQKWIRSQLSS